VGIAKAERRYRYHWALREITFSVSPGALVGITGESGADKSTLLKILAGSLHPERGRVGPVRRVERI
jgi:ABC-type polysaccharide/polyol phosphate transport system ATPase subunit